MIETSRLYLWLSHLGQVRVAMTVSAGQGCADIIKWVVLVWACNYVIVFVLPVSLFSFCFFKMLIKVSIRNVKTISEET